MMQGNSTNFLERMKFIVKCMYENGVVLSDDEFALKPSYFGELVIQEVCQGRERKWPILQARLLSIPNGCQKIDLITPLFDPSVKDEGKGIIVHGYQLHINEVAGVQCIEQCWQLLAPVHWNR